MKKVLKEILSTSLYLLIVLCLTYVVIHFVGQRTQVIGGSMETTLSENDNLIVDKLTYRFREPKRFDIIVFPFQHEEDTYYIKRIIGLPGETIYIDEEGNIYIDDEILQESYGKEVIKDAGRAYEPVVLGDDILLWGTTAITAKTAVTLPSGIFPEAQSSAGHGYGYGL